MNKDEMITAFIDLGNRHGMAALAEAAFDSWNEKTDEIDRLVAEVKALRARREATDDFLGQRGVKILSAMIEIIEAARAWGEDDREGEGGLSQALYAYEEMVEEGSHE